MDRIGKYEVRRPLGEGATATVYLAYDPFARREVAVKRFLPEALRNQERGRVHRHLLVNEASLAGRLSHPHIVQIYDAVVADAESYVVMEYVAGGTLEQFCAVDRLLPLERLVEMIFKCTRALDYAHRLGIIHRDIKPANILLVAAEGSDIKISDFGAALLDNDEQSHTQVTGVGSPAYMSPEQVQEQPLNQQTDIYSLGVVMYRLLTGRLPFQASSNYGMIHQICNDTPPPPSALRADIPAAVAARFDAVVARAMARDRSQRYPDWDAFSHDLTRCFRGGDKLVPQRQEMPDSEKFETLRGMTFFREFSDVEIWEVVRFSHWQDAPAETVLMKDGDLGDAFCFLLFGEAHVVKKGRTLSVLNPGDCFGEMAVIGGNKQRSADVVGRSPTRIMVIQGDTLDHASDACRMHFYQGFLAVLSKRLNSANNRLAAF
ncbi:hypothetical protein DLREEDagrD3_03070 [Denitratisoma sp. agr-D3]